METYLVEHYEPGMGADGLEAAAAELRRAADALRYEGLALRYVRSTILPEDEALLSVLEAASPALARAAHERAGVPCDRVTRAIDVDRRSRRARRRG